jgi:phage-related protein
LQGSIGAGDLIIDFTTKSVTYTGISILSHLTLSSRFFELRQGANAVSTTNGAAGTLYWKERWI